MTKRALKAQAKRLQKEPAQNAPKISKLINMLKIGSYAALMAVQEAQPAGNQADHPTGVLHQILHEVKKLT